MYKLILLSFLTISISACSATQQEVAIDQNKYCNTSSEYRISNGQTVGSEVLVECTDKPRVEHFVKNQGTATQCRSYNQTVTIKGRQKNVKGFLCQFPDGSWEAVDGSYAY